MSKHEWSTLRLLEGSRFLAEKTTQVSNSGLDFRALRLVQETRSARTNPFHPRSPYASPSFLCYWMVGINREPTGCVCLQRILLTMRKPAPAKTFREPAKITPVSNSRHALREMHSIANIDSLRDWEPTPRITAHAVDDAATRGADDFVIPPQSNIRCGEFIT